jgi:hypothetical protein
MSTNALELYAGFVRWADGVLRQPVPAEVVAFSFNLYEGDSTFDLQISGSSSFDPKDQGWACNPIFLSEEDLFSIPRAMVSDEWEAALELVLGWVRSYFQTGKGSAVLRASRGVGVGFVDGDLHLVWPDAVA